MSPCIVFGSYGGHSAIVSIDPTAPTSLLSSRFAKEHRLRDLAKCPLRLPSIGGVYVSRMPITVVEDLTKFDLVIGADWIATTKAVVTPHGLARPSKGDVIRLKLRKRAGHTTWVAIPNGRLNKSKGVARGLVGEAYGPFQIPLSIRSQISLRNGPTRRGVEVPFDITHYILSLLVLPVDPYSYELGIDVLTLMRLCLVSRSFNLAANAILYSSICVSEVSLLSLSRTAHANPGLFNHCHSIWFEPPLYSYSVVPWGPIAHIISCCPNLRRVEWVHGPGSIRMSMFSWHLPQLTDMLFPHISLLSLHTSPTTHFFPHLERLVVANTHFSDPAVVGILLQMPQLTDLITDPPQHPHRLDDVEAYARGVATVVMHTALRRIIWAHIYSTDFWNKTADTAVFDTYKPVCRRAQAMLRASPVSGRTFKEVLRNAASVIITPGVSFEFVPWGLSKIRSGIFNGTIWDPDFGPRDSFHP